jgi:hypothetical protein
MNRLQARKRKTSRKLTKLSQVDGVRATTKVIDAIAATGAVARAAVRLRVGYSTLKSAIRRLGISGLARSAAATWRKRFRIPARQAE